MADSLERSDSRRCSPFWNRGSHVPTEARDQILAVLGDCRHETLVLDANHTFMRDDGWRWDPELADQAWAAVIAFLNNEI